MKIPEVFIPEKDLNNKTNNFTKGCKQIPHEDPINLSIEDIVRIGERVSEKFGNFGMESYKFKNKETNLKIKYTPECWPETLGSLRIYLKKNFFKKEKVFEYSRNYKEPLLRYLPGDWEKDLKNIYDKTFKL